MPIRGTRRRHGAVAIAATAALAVCGAASAGVAAPATGTAGAGRSVEAVRSVGAVRSAGAGTPDGTLVLRYSFEARTPAGAVDESGRGHVLRRATAAGGTTRVVGHDPGRAVAFPAKCTGSRCPRAVLQVADRADLNPGAAPFGFGATVRLARDQTTAGQNVVQKGYSTTGSQYKLQIDGAAGQPSCVLVDRRDMIIRLARGNRSVADGAWHTVACRRSRTALSIEVDGAVRGQIRVPAGLTVVNDSPLSIAGKGAYQNNDQFQGAVDDVWVSVG